MTQFQPLSAVEANAADSLKWEETLLSTVADGSGKIAVFYNFTNISDSEISIEKVSSTCGCTAASVDKTTFASGESGVVKAVFNPAGLIGLHSKRIAVDIGVEIYQLTLNVTIAPLARLEPDVLQWRRGEVSVEKHVDIISDETIAGVTVQSSDQLYVAKVERDETDGRFMLKVYPRSTSAAARGLVSILVTFGDRREQQYSIIVKNM